MLLKSAFPISKIRKRKRKKAKSTTPSKSKQERKRRVLDVTGVPGGLLMRPVSVDLCSGPDQQLKLSFSGKALSNK